MKRSIVRLALVTAILVGLTATGNGAENVGTGSIPDWVETRTLDLSAAVGAADETGGTAYLLVDRQVNLLRRQRYRHYAVKVLNSTGVQDASDVDAEFDPAFQSLRLHFIRIHRQGKILAKLSAADIRTFQREESMERNLYDGSLTAVVHLTDVRRGDIIEYAYTISGFNPIHADQFAAQTYLRYGAPLGEFYVRVVAAATDRLTFRTYHGAPDPDRRTTSHGEELIWHLKDLSAYELNLTSPAWYHPYPRVGLSTYHNWNAVVEWALPLYRINGAEMEKLQRHARELMPAKNLD